MKVSYKGHKYRVRFWHGMLYLLLSIWLGIQRTFRRLGKLINFISPVLFLLPIWIAFMFTLSTIEKQHFLCYVDECKYSIFSSVVIAAIIRLQGKVPEYRKNLRLQHEMYVSLMGDVDCFIEYIFETVVLNNCQTVDVPVWPLYTTERYRKLDEALCSCSVSNNFSTPKLESFLALIMDDINSLKSLNGKGGLQVDDNIDYRLDCAYRRVKEFQSKLKQKTLDTSTIEYTIRDLFFLVDEVRYPWRRDKFANEMQRMIIVKNHPDPDDRDHYFNLFEVI